MGTHAVVLCIQDTTGLYFNGRAITGLGALGYEPQRDMYLNSTYVFMPDREPLDMLHA